MAGYTFGEKLGLARHAVQGGRRAHMGLDTSRHDDGIDAIKDRRADRDEREARIAEAAIERAREDVAAAEFDVRRAKAPDKRAARRARDDAKRALRRAERSAPRR